MASISKGCSDVRKSTVDCAAVRLTQNSLLLLIEKGMWCGIYCPIYRNGTKYARALTYRSAKRTQFPQQEVT